MNDLLTKNLNKTITTGSLALTRLPLCPDIALYLISEDYPKGRLPDEEMLAIMDKPAYWAFCWASGQALAAHLLELCVDKVDLLIAADVLYDRENIPWLERLGRYADEVLIADSRIRDDSVFNGFEKIGDISTTTIPDLDELKEFGDVTIYYRKYR